MTERIPTWWTEPEGQVHDPLLSLAHTLERYDAEHQQDSLMGMALYGDKEAQKSVIGDTYVPGFYEEGRLSYNLVRSVCNALQAHIAAQHTLSRVLTSRGNWTLQRKAKQCEQLIEGDFDRNNVHTQAHEGFLDACKTGTTGFKVYTLGGKTQIDLVRPGEVLVDPVDGRYRDPRCIYQVYFLDREVVLGLYGDDEELAAKIMGAPTDHGKSMFPWLPSDTSIDTIKVVEAWKKPDPDDWNDASSGRHVICIEGATLLDEEWDRSLPFVFWRYEEPASGFWGQGPAQNLHGLQTEINYTLRKISRCLKLNAGFRILTDDQSEVTEEDITNSPGQVIRYKAGTTPPQVILLNSVPPEFRNHLQDCINRGFEQEGVSQLAAQSKKPGGLNSGEAIREYNDIESARFAIKSKSFERFIGVHLAKLVIEEKQWAATEGVEEPTRARNYRRKGFTFVDVKWSEIGLDPNDYQIKVSPASELPRTSAGRQATIEAWIGAGFLDRNQALALTRTPDLEEWLAMELAPYEVILDAIEDMIEEGVYSPPESVQDIALSLRLASNAYQRHKVDGVPEDRRELLLLYISDLEHMQQEAEEAMALKQAQQQGGQMQPTPPVAV